MRPTGGPEPLAAELVRQLGELADERGGGYALIETLDFLGWSTAVVSALGGGVLLIAQQRAYPFMEVHSQADSVAEAAPDLFTEALTYNGYRRGQVEH